jgi:hypothetical protein
MKPSVGRIVHYVSYGTPGGEYTSECRAAVITEIYENVDATEHTHCVGLAILNPTGMFFNPSVSYDEPHDRATISGGRLLHKGGTWHWPERVDG